MNKKTEKITIQQYNDIIDTLVNGCSGKRPSLRTALAVALVAEAGCSLKEACQIRYEDIIINKDCFNVVAEDRIFHLEGRAASLLQELFQETRSQTGLLLDLTERAIQRNLSYIVDYLGYGSIGIHSFKELFRAKKGMEQILSKSPARQSNCEAIDIAGVYSIRCKTNGKIYIGESDNIADRWEQHKKDLISHTHHSKRLQDDYDKFGSNQFSWNVLAKCSDRKERLAMEANFISSLGTIRYGYNTRA